jgi:hypothetical protein
MAVWSREEASIRQQISTLSGNIQSDRKSIQESERSISKSSDMIKRYQEYLEKGSIIYGDSKIDSIEDNAKATTTSVNEKLDILHKKVCDKQINSPLCKDRETFNRLYHLTEARIP